MTTREKRPGIDRALDAFSGEDVQVRLWVGRNPLLFVAVCVMIGYWIGRGTGGAGRP